DQLRELAPLLDHPDELVLAADRPQHARVGRVAGLALATRGEAQLLEQDPGTCCVEPSMNSSPASSYALASSSSTRSASRAVISPIRYVSIRTPASSMSA